MQKLRNSKAGRIVRGWYKRLSGATSTMAKDRLIHCNPCPFNVTGICIECYCAVKAKAQVEEEKCPKGYW